MIPPRIWCLIAPAARVRLVVLLLLLTACADPAPPRPAQPEVTAAVSAPARAATNPPGPVRARWAGADTAWPDAAAAVRAWTGGPVKAAREPGTGIVEVLEFPQPSPPLAVEAILPELLRRFPELFGHLPPGELVVQELGTTRVRYRQVRGGLPVFLAFLEVQVDDHGVHVRGRLARSAVAPAPDPATKPAAVALAHAFLAGDPVWARRIPADGRPVASPVWFDPGMLFPESPRGAAPGWLVSDARRVGPEVVTDAAGAAIVYVREAEQPTGQLLADLVSYLPPPGVTRPFEARAWDLLGLREGSVVADVGAGSGALSWPLSARVGAGGTVWANEVDDVSVDFLRRRLAGDPPPHANIRVVRAFFDDMALPPASLDAAVLCEVHFFLAREEVNWKPALTSLARALRPWGKVVVVEGRTSGSIAAMRERFEAVGLRFVTSEPASPTEWLLLFSAE